MIKLEQDPREEGPIDPFKQNPEMAELYKAINMAPAPSHVQLDLSESGTLTISQPRKEIFCEVIYVDFAQKYALSISTTAAELWHTFFDDMQETADCILRSSTCGPE